MLLFLFALTPLVVSDSFYLFPFVLPKVIFLRSVIGLALILFLADVLAGFFKTRTFPSFRFWKNPIFIFVCLFLISAALSSIFAPNAYRAFFGNAERSEGLYGILHYFVFMILSLLIFRKKDWFTFFKILLVVGFISSFYAWLQYLRIDKFPLAFPAEAQPGSFHGNPAFLASYLILLFAPAAFIFLNSKEGSFWRYASVFVSVFAFATVFITAIRGAILGLAAGLTVLLIILAFSSKLKVRKLFFVNISVILLLVLIAFGFTFWTTKDSPFWLKIPGLNRLTSLSFENPSVVTRLVGLKISWDAFKEKPILGWGMENYGIAYNKHFDPSYSFYAEDWFDRAHNRVADIAVMQGLFGFLAYFGLLGSVFYLFFKEWKKKNEGEISRAAPVLAAVFAAYFVNNFFLFDQITSYIPLFGILGFLIAESNIGRSDLPNIDGNVRRSDLRGIGQKINPYLFALPALVLTGGVLWALYFWNYLPVYQVITLRDAVRSRVGQNILAASDKFLTPYNYIQMEIRKQFLEIIYNSKLITNEKFKPLADKALQAMEEFTDKEPFDPRHFSSLIESYNERAKEDPSLFTKTEVFARKAVALSPNRQGLLYHLAFTLAGEERFDEAIELSRETLALDPRIAKAHYELAINLALAADSEKYKGTPKQMEYRTEALKELDEALDLGSRRLGSLEPYSGSDITNTQYYLFLESDLKNMVILYRSLGLPDRMAKVLEILIVSHPENKDYRYDAMVVYRALRDKDKIIEHAEALKKLDPALASDMDTIIDLAEKGEWEILDSF
ncbi:MAG: O-antigen ligase [Parcubacteria group bacterium GW2011_GWB1_45_10]|nr:MAG: O-antigen ligase [Parcubacteria group bacterium GW2011_GWB1_45_10]